MEDSMPAKKTSILFCALALCGLAACGEKTVMTSTTLSTAAGQMVGNISFSQTGTAAVQVVLTVSGISPGKHGAHVHDIGKCDPPDFMSAGGHFNPTTMMHGDPAGTAHHVGDLGNIDVASDGTGMLTASSDVMSLVADNVGFVGNHAFIVHANPDDLVGQPTGNAGGRLACGVIPPPQQ
jgi:Cu-Zn family superoxide dismutase